jgi:hypothetical protein
MCRISLSVSEWALLIFRYELLHSSGSGIASAFLAKVIGPSTARKVARPNARNTIAERDELGTSLHKYRYQSPCVLGN